MEPTLPEGPPAAPVPARPAPSAAIGFFVALLGLVLFDALAQVANPVAGLAWSELFTMLLPALVAAQGSNLRAIRYLGLGRPRAVPVALGALAGLVGYFPAAAIAGLWMELLPRPLVEQFPDVARIFRGPLMVQIAMTALAVGLAPLCEEIAFRGYLQRTLARAVGPGIAVAAGGLLFAIRHLDPIRFAPLVFLGILFGWLSWRSGSLWPAIAAHAANNAVGSAMALTGAGAETTPAPDVALGEALAALVAGGVILAGLAIVYRRATPAPPAAEAFVEPRDPLLPTTRFLPWLVPVRLHWAGILGIVALLALLVASQWRTGT